MLTRKAISEPCLLSGINVDSTTGHFVHSLRQFGDHGRKFFRRAVNSATLSLRRTNIIEHDFLRRHKFGRHIRNFIGDFQRNSRHAVQIAMQQIAIMNRSPPTCTGSPMCRMWQ